MTARIAVLDIETAPLTSWAWGTWDQNLSLEMIQRDWFVIAFAWKWLHDSRVTYFDQSKAEDVEDDSGLLQKVWDLLDSADIVIAHNGQKFDFKKLNARFITLGWNPPSPYRVIDTLVEVKRVAAFTSNKLAFLTDALCTAKKSSHVKFPGFLLWKECLLGNPKAWAEMKKYNKQDVLSLEELYLRLRPWMVTHPNVMAYELSGDDALTGCTRCGGYALVRQGYRVTQTGRYRRWRCTGCGGWSQERLMEKENREGLLSN